MKTALLVCLLTFLSFPAFTQEIEYIPEKIYGQLLSDPHDLYIDSNGDMYVADSYHTRVFDNTGKFKRDYSYPMGDDRFAITKSNVNVAQDQQGNFYMLGKNNLVRKIDKEGNILLTFGEVENLPWNVEYTSGIAIDQDGYIYVSDTYHNHIIKYNQQGQEVKRIGSAGSELGQFNSPSQILIDQTGNLLVTDTKNGRIQIFTSSGEFLRKIGQAENNGAPMYPVDLALDVAGNIYVADTMSYMIRKFDPQGKVMSYIGAKGPDNGKFETPNLKVALDSSGNIYVVENYGLGNSRSRIQKFNNQGNYISTVIDNKSTNDYVLIASDQEGNFVSANYGTGLIKKYNTKGEFLLSFNSREDTLAGYIGTMKDIATDKQGNIYVLDNTRYGSVKIYTPYGQLIRRFAPDYEYSRENSYDHSIPYEAYKLAFDTEGNIYVGDTHHKIFKYNARGELLKKIKMFNPVTGDSIQFDINTSFDISKQNELYVISKNGIQKFDFDGNYIGDFIPSDIQTYNGEAKEIDFDQEGNIYIIELGYIKRYNYEGILLSTSSYNHSLVNQGIYSNISVNRNGTRIVVSTYNKASVFVSKTRSDNYTSVKNFISGSVYNDKNENCIRDPEEKGLEGIVIEATPGPYYGVSDISGKYFIKVDSGTYSIAQILPTARGIDISEQCASEKQIQFSSLGSTSANNDFGNKVTLSPYLTVSVSSTRRRRCFESTTKLTYSNKGFAPAANAKVYVQLPEQVELLSADKPFTRLPNGTYVFDAGTVAAGQTSVITIQDKVVCGDESIRGMTVCTKAWITPGNQSPTAPPAPVISVTGTCNPETGKVRFVIKNTGQVDMEESEQFRKYVNGLLSTVEDYRLAAGDSLVLWVPAGGRTIRLEADQPDGNGDNTLASTTVEACSTEATQTAFSTGFVNVLPTDDEEAEVAEECLPIIDSFDPNDKLVTPTGRTEENFTPTGVALKYKIRFQNTGTDVAYRVVVVDTLSEHLDLSTLQIGSASHTYRYELSGKGKPVLTWIFDNIMLPDSTSNEPGSHGYIQFSIKPKAELPEKTAVENFSDIFFDYNSPVRTNITVNRIYDMPLVVDESVRLNLEQIIATPAISGFAPAAGKLGAEVTLSGLRFSTTANSNKVYVNGVLAPVISASETELKVLVPADATTGALQIVTPDGAASTTEVFEVYQPPVLSSFSPAEGVVGDTVTLQGERFDPTLIQNVTLGTQLCDIISNTGNKLVVRVPAEAMTSTFKIITKGGETESTTAFVVWHQPSIRSLSKTTDKAGATINIDGEHFAPAAERNIVFFGQAQAEVLQASPAQLTVNVPAGAASGYITVETPGGIAISTTSFEVIPAPAFSSMAPSRGSVGTEVEIFGANFRMLGVPDEITFNGEKALILEASFKRYTVRVPRGATSGKVKITGYGGIAYSTTDFVVEELTPTQAIAIYPNPTTGHFTISFQHADFDVQAVQVYSSVGKLIHTTAVANPRPEKLEMNMGIAQSGLYVLQIRTDRGLIIKKLTVL